MILTIPENDHGPLYIFDVSATAPKQPEALAGLLGQPELDLDFVDLVPLADISEKGIEWYLRTGYELEPSATDLIALSTIGSHMLIVMSRAFAGKPADITLPEGLRHVTTLSLPGIQPDLSPLHSTAAEGILPPVDTAPPPPEDRASGRVWLYALIVIFGFFALMAWRIASGNI